MNMGDDSEIDDLTYHRSVLDVKQEKVTPATNETSQGWRVKWKNIEKCRREKNKKVDGRSDVEENPRRQIDGLPDRFDEKITD